MAEITLEFIAERLERIQVEQTAIRAEQADMRTALANAIDGVKDDMAVLTAIVLRLEGKVERETRITHERFGRMTERLARLESERPS